MTSTDEITFEKPSKSGLKLFPRHIIAYVCLSILTVLLLYVMINKTPLFDYLSMLKETSIEEFVIVVLAAIGTIFCIIKTNAYITKNKVFIRPWDSILFSWSGIVLLLTVISTF